MTSPSPRPGTLNLTIEQNFSRESEQRAIGLVLSWPKTWQSFQKLQPSDFFDEVNAMVWKAIKELHEHRQPSDLPAVLMQLAPRYGGFDSEAYRDLNAYLTGCVMAVHSAAGYESTVGLLSEMGRKRALAEKIVGTGIRLSRSLITDTASQIAQDHIQDIQRSFASTSSLIDAGALTQQIIDKLDEEVRVSSTGWPRLDKVLDGGFVETYYYILGGRKKGFKTTTLTSISYNMIVREDPIPHDYYCLEQTAEQVYQKMLARWISEVFCVKEGYGVAVNANHFRNRYVRKEQWFRDALHEARKYFEDRGLRFLARSRMDLNDLASEITAAGLEGRARGVIVDYAQLIRTPLAEKGLMTAHLDHVHQTLAELAVNNPLWIVGAVQLNQTGGIRGGEGGNAAASMVLNVHKVDVTPPGSDGPAKFEAWLEMADTRYTAEMDVGGDGELPEGAPESERNPEPAYVLDGDIGPCLREKPDPKERERELEEVRASR